MSHGHHSYQKASVMDMGTIFAYWKSQHALPHCKCVLRCFDNFQHIDIPSQELYDHHSNTCPTISFHVYHLLVLF